MRKASIFRTKNKVIQFLTVSDFILYSALGLIGPFVTIFITDKVIGGTLATAGLSITLHYIVRGILQIPVSQMVDKKKGEYDDYQFLFWGTMISGAAYFLFAFATRIEHIYALQALNAIGVAFTIPTWYAIFTRHVNKNHAASQWTYYDTMTSLGSAFTAGLGGLAISIMSYKTVFIIVSFFVFLSGLFILGIRDSLKS